MYKHTRTGVSDLVKVAGDSKGAGHGIFAAADANGNYTIGAQHVLNFRSERDRMRLAAVIHKRRLRRRNLSERNDRAHCLPHSGCSGVLFATGAIGRGGDLPPRGETASLQAVLPSRKSRGRRMVVRLNYRVSQFMKHEFKI